MKNNIIYTEISKTIFKSIHAQVYRSSHVKFSYQLFLFQRTFPAQSVPSTLSPKTRWRRISRKPINQSTKSVNQSVNIIHGIISYHRLKCIYFFLRESFED